MKKRISLNYNWSFKDDFHKEYINSTNIPDQVLINIPHTMKEIPLNYFDEESYQYTGIYSKNLVIDEEMKKGKIFVSFAGVMTVATVYLNGELLLTHEGGYTPFKVDITGVSIIGDNLLQVVVDSKEIPNVPPFGHLVDYLAFSGIYREVSLELLPNTYINEALISTSETEYLEEDAMVLTIDLGITQDNEKEYLVKVKILDSNKKLVARFTCEEKIINTKLYTSTISKINRWSINSPNLYYCQIEIYDEEELIDSLITRFGFRTVRFTSEGFLLNNKPIKLIGLNRHQSYPYVGYAMPKSMQALDADILKDFGCNIARTSHYMQSEHFLNRCDEIGLLVLEETAGWQYIGDEHFKELTYQNIEVMIKTHYNHPSIIAWGVRINESRDNNEFYTKTNELARNLDITRQTCGVRNTKKGDFLEDIYTYNDFSHVGNNDGLEKPSRVVPGYYPYLVTEHNGHVFPTKKFDSEVRRIEHALRHTNVIDKAFEYDRISGAIGWCLADYNTHYQFGSNDRICYHGVMDMFRIPKYASYAYKALREDEPVLFVANSMIPGDFKEFKLPEVIVFSNCDSIKLYRNDLFVGEYLPASESYPHILNSPYIIEDLIGEILVDSNNYSEKDARKITELLVAYNKYGFNLPIKHKLAYLSLKRRKVINDYSIMEIAEKYVALQEHQPVVFRFEGYINDELVISKSKGHSKEFKLDVKTNTNILEHGYTYDVLRMVISLTDEHDTTLTYGNEVISIETSESLSVIGPKTISLIGGSIGVYIKSISIDDKAWIRIKSNNYPDKEIKISIKEGVLEG